MSTYYDNISVIIILLQKSDASIICEMGRLDIELNSDASLLGSTLQGTLCAYTLKNLFRNDFIETYCIIMNMGVSCFNKVLEKVDSWNRNTCFYSIFQSILSCLNSRYGFSS